MKFRRKMVLAYTTVAFLGSLMLGIVVARLGFEYEMTNQKNNLRVAAKSYVAQMDEVLGRMDAIMNYILSDANLLESITWLAEEQKEEVPNRFVLDARSILSTGLTTEYIMKNSYRTVFFNQNSFLASSYIYTPNSDNTPTQRLISDFRVEDIPYLEPVVAARGESVIVTAHPDYWGAYGNVLVFSLIKALQGEGMGFLEVECRMESLDLLERTDSDIEFLIVVNGEEFLYASNEEYGTELSESERKLLRSMQEDIIFTKDGDIYIMESSSDYELTVLAYKKSYALEKGRQQFFLVSFLIALMTFSISLTMVIFWAGILTRPVKHLQEIVENTNIENLQDNHQLEKAGGPDEFQELIHAYQAMTKRLDKAVQDEKRATMLQLQAQFNMLQAQVNPHFIYNVLNTISSRAVLDNDEVICEICGSFGNMLRYSTSNKERYASVEMELEYLDNYFYLLKVRYGERLQVSIDVDQGVRKQTIPKMTLQQLVENCVKHGLQNTDECIHISVMGKMQKGSWIIQIQDNGVGVSRQTLLGLKNKLEEVRKNLLERAMTAEMEIGGMGIVNTYARCVLLYFDDLIFEMENVPVGHGFVVTVGQKF